MGVLAEVAGEIADAEWAIGIAVIFEWSLRVPCEDRFLVPACPIQMFREQLLGRIVGAVVQGHEQIGVCGRVGGPKCQRSPLAVDGGPQIEPAVVQGCEQSPDLVIVGLQGRRPTQGRDGFVETPWLRQGNCKIALRLEPGRVEPGGRFERGHRFLWLACVGEDNSEGVLKPGCAGRRQDRHPGQRQRRPEPPLPVRHDRQQV
jgi:hypothetical protein